MADRELRIVMIVIDAMPHRHVSPELTPNLWRQSTLGLRAPDGGESLPMSVTYANHAAFVTGADPATTGVYGNHTWIDGDGWVPAPKAGPRATTLFERVADVNGRSVLVVGDHKLVAQMGGAEATECWPPSGWFPDGTERCEFGYARDAAVVDAVRATDLDADLVVLHLNEPDTTSHFHGPDSPAAIKQYRTTDVAYGELIDELADGWDHTVVITLSDHDQETIDDQTPVALLDALAPFREITAVADGTAALLHGPVNDKVLAAAMSVDGIDGHERLSDDVWMIWSSPGRMISGAPIALGGQHGSPRCRTQLAMISGGHPMTNSVAEQMLTQRPSALAWAPAIAELLGLDALPEATLPLTTR